MQTLLTELLGIEHPILLAPMGNVSGGALAAAVSHAGGLGLIGGGYGDADWLAREFDVAGSAQVGVGFITWSLARQPKLLDLALRREPAAVMFSFGACSPFVEPVRAAGAKIICQVQTLAQAREVAELGVDVIVAQGTEAGGHGGGRSTFTLVPAVADAVAPIPVVAAGGIADGRGLAAARMLGAAGALIGTRFFASEEALGHPNAKRFIVASEGDTTLRTRVFDIVRDYPWPKHITGRVPINAFAARWHGREAALYADLERQRVEYQQAVENGDTDTAVAFAGEAVDLIGTVEPAQTIVERIVSQAQSLLGG
ncbi:nitronate monooxygenase [Spectribacter hydrogenoxidans]|uniref:Nitronate monooxygenase n=1 Tax=Spectribacter hydrogenoxidans TaxID=3075608 RepID=A0ABU3C2B4_9GAMM|nr:nitronate monooxygenase [Salinisphaera sp. W335]MDT0635702.1 nitronate monooxygenase [Salinisphaera sp. W335]